MQEVATGLGLILPLIEKGGATVFLAGIAWYFWRQNEKKAVELAAVYAQRDAYRAAFDEARYKMNLLKIKFNHGDGVDLDLTEPKIVDIPKK